MSDSRLRDLERRWQASGAVEDEGALLLERVRAGQLEHWTLIQMALLGNPGARFAESVLETENFPRAREFLGNILQHDQDGRATLAHYELVEEGDKAPPDTGTALEALFDHLKNNPGHVEAINQMQKPVLQLIPVYKPEGAGFQRMVNALDNHPREGQVNTYVRDELNPRWGMNGETPGKIVGWQVVVVEGDKELSEERNPHWNESIGEQLRLWQEECAQRDLELSNNRSYALLQMREIMTAPAGTPLTQLGIDPNTFTVLKDPTRQAGSLVPSGDWFEVGARFLESNPGGQAEAARFRPAVVVKRIL
jgi:hypothetical protein